MHMAISTRTKSPTEGTNRDAELFENVRRALFATGHPQLQKIGISAHEGYVVLKGTVATYYEIQVAQTAVMHVNGVETLKNEIFVL